MQFRRSDQEKREGASQQHGLEEQQAGAPHRGSSSELRQQTPRDNRLYLKQQKRAQEYGDREPPGGPSRSCQCFVLVAANDRFVEKNGSTFCSKRSFTWLV